MGVNLAKIHPSTKWSKTGCGTVQVSPVCHLHSSREVKLLTCNDNNCPMFNAYFYSSCLNFSWHMNGWKQRYRTLVWWGILQWEHMPGLQLDSRSPLIVFTTILWQTLSYEHPKLWAKKQVLVSFHSGALWWAASSGGWKQLHCKGHAGGLNTFSFSEDCVAKASGVT